MKLKTTISRYNDIEGAFLDIDKSLMSRHYDNNDIEALNFDITVSSTLYSLDIDAAQLQYCCLSEFRPSVSKIQISKFNIVHHIENNFQNVDIEVCDFDIEVYGYRVPNFDTEVWQGSRWAAVGSGKTQRRCGAGRRHCRRPPSHGWSTAARARGESPTILPSINREGSGQGTDPCGPGRDSDGASTPRMAAAPILGPVSDSESETCRRRPTCVGHRDRGMPARGTGSLWNGHPPDVPATQPGPRMGSVMRFKGRVARPGGASTA